VRKIHASVAQSYVANRFLDSLTLQAKKMESIAEDAVRLQPLVIRRYNIDLAFWQPVPLLIQLQLKIINYKPLGIVYFRSYGS
jgi:hypothetical protein